MSISTFSSQLTTRGWQEDAAAKAVKQAQPVPARRTAISTVFAKLKRRLHGFVIFQMFEVLCSPPSHQKHIFMLTAQTPNCWVRQRREGSKWLQRLPALRVLCGSAEKAELRTPRACMFKRWLCTEEAAKASSAAQSWFLLTNTVSMV